MGEESRREEGGREGGKRRVNCGIDKIHIG